MTTSDLGYVSSLYGGFWNFTFKDFCYMTNQYFPPEAFFDAMGARFRQLVKAYPSTNWYVSSLAAAPLGLTHHQLVVGNGASELISVITSLFVKRLAVPIPTFDEYINRAKILGREVTPYQLHGDMELDITGFIQHVEESKANAALLIRPNNPTGTYANKSDMARLLVALRNLDLVLVDESFIEFVTKEAQPSVLDMAAEFPNLMVIKSLSKNYGIPGLRLGYVASANEERMAKVRLHLPVWGINSLAQCFLEELQQYKPNFDASTEYVRQATQTLSQGLQTIPFLRVFPTNGNFVMCEVLSGLTSTQFVAKLYNEFNILINDCGKKQGIDHRFVRIASRTLEENVQLVETLHSLEASPSIPH